MGAPGNNRTPIRRSLERLRLLIGDLGVRGLLLLGLAIHFATIWIAFRSSAGAWAWIAAALSATIPAIPEIYWAYRVFEVSGTVTHPYVAAVIGYPVACALFLIGGYFFFPDQSSMSTGEPD